MGIDGTRRLQEQKGFVYKGRRRPEKGRSIRARDGPVGLTKHGATFVVRWDIGCLDSRQRLRRELQEEVEEVVEACRASDAWSASRVIESNQGRA